MYELLAEIDSLRREKEPARLEPAASVSFAPIDDSLQQSGSQIFSDFAAESGSQEVRSEGPVPPVSDYSNSGVGVPAQSHPSTTSNPRTLQGLTVSGEDIDDCFQMSVIHLSVPWSIS